MKLDKLISDRFKERPSECVIDSHAFMVRGGYIKAVANGIYSQYPALKRVSKKIENIIREEMDKIDGQEVLFPVVLPASLWEESGRFESVGSELLRFKDRNNSQMVLGMTHEEACVHLVREYGHSYNRYPFMLYQIQTKFRDEARSRGGLIRVREFTMKDAYSFHTSQEDLQDYYDKCFKAYQRIFARAGIPEVISVESDSGMMGGSLSHEFMLLTPIGEDSIAVCEKCGYRANMEAAKSIIVNNSDEQLKNLELVKTPDQKTIEDVCNYLKKPVESSCKAVVYQKDSDNSFVIIFTRGDIEVNETKVKNFIKDNIHPALIDEESGITAGFIGPKDLKVNGKYTVLFDSSLKGVKNIVAGANKIDYHYTGLNFGRDIEEPQFNDFAKIIDGGICPSCNENSISIKRGIEVGNIFQLGTKYTKSMNMQYLDKNGQSQYPIMGCYGIGVGRLAASVIEEKHDKFGPIWPISIAPWQVHLCCVRADDKNAKAIADNLYNSLQASGIEVIYDDRDVRAGVMFSDADLIGSPIRVIVSPRNLEKGIVEIVTRDKQISINASVDSAEDEVKKLIKKLFDEIEKKANNF